MTRRSEEENNKWEQLQKNFDTMFSQMAEMSTAQKEMKAQMNLYGSVMDDYSKEQHTIAQKVQANGDAIGKITLRQMEQEVKHNQEPKFDDEPLFDEEDIDSLIHEQPTFENIFAKDKKPEAATTSKQLKTDHQYTARQERRQNETSSAPQHAREAATYTVRHHDREMEADRDPRLPKHIMPKMDFPDFYGEDPKVWLDNCRDYFALYKIPEGMWVIAARVHLKEKAARWYQAFKQKNTFRSWNHFCHEVEQEFGADDFRKAMNDLLELRQTTTVEEYTSQFQTLHYGIMMHQAGYDDMFFTQHYVKGLKEDIRGIVEAQMPTTVLKASTLAQVQQGVLERTKPRNRPAYQQRGYNQQRMEYKQPQQTSQLWRDRQLRDYRKANNLCYSCGEKYVPGHNEVCAKKQKPQMNALALNELDLDRELSEETLNALDTEDKLHEEFCQLSINAMSSQDTLSCVKLKARVKDKVMIILMDSGSSHSFISSTFVQLAQLPTATIPAKRVKLANGAWMETTQQVSKLKWYCQGHTLTTDMVVIDMQPYDAILGYDWLKTHSPMNCDWEHTTITFPRRVR